MSAAVGARAAARRSRTWALVAAALLAVLGVWVGVACGRRERRRGLHRVGRVRSRSPSIASTTDDGSDLDVAVAGLRPGETCRLVVVDRDGDWHAAGSGPPPTTGDGRWRGWADVDRVRAGGGGPAGATADASWSACRSEAPGQPSLSSRTLPMCSLASTTPVRLGRPGTSAAAGRRSGRTTPRSTSGQTSCSTAATISALPPGPGRRPGAQRRRVTPRRACASASRGPARPSCRPACR